MFISQQKVLAVKRSLTVEIFVAWDKELIHCDHFILKQSNLSFSKSVSAGRVPILISVKVISIWKEKVFRKLTILLSGRLTCFFQFQKVQDVVERPPLYRPPPAFCDGKLEVRKGPFREGLPSLGHLQFRRGGRGGEVIGHPSRNAFSNIAYLESFLSFSFSFISNSPGVYENG